MEWEGGKFIQCQASKLIMWLVCVRIISYFFVWQTAPVAAEK